MKEVIQAMYAPALRQWRKWNIWQRVTVIWWQVSFLLILGLADAHYLAILFATLNFGLSTKFLIKVPTDELGDD